MTPAGPSAFHLIATLDFDDMASIQAAFGSPEGQAAAADIQNFATGGADMLMSDTRRSQSRPRFEYLCCAAGFQETRDVRKRVLRRPHYGRLAVRVLR